jgi:hypothetical protein
MAPAMTDNESRDEIIRIEKAEAAIKLKELVNGRIPDDFIIISQDSILATLKGLKFDAYNDWVFAGLKEGGLLKRLFIGSTTLSIINESDLLTVAVPIISPIDVPQKLIVGVTYKYPLNKAQFDLLLSSFSGQIREVEFFTILEKGEDETKELNHLAQLQSEYAVYGSSVFLLKGEDKFMVLKNHVEQAERPFLVLQQGSRTLDDKLFRKFMISEVVYSGQIPLIIISK